MSRLALLIAPLLALCHAVHVSRSQAKLRKATCQKYKKAHERKLHVRTSSDVCKRDFFLTLETCVQPLSDGTVHVITGDIPNEWIRDSSAQLYPYVSFAKSEGKHSKMRPILEGALRRQAKYIAIDPYANSFNKDWDPNGDKRLNRGGFVGTGNFEIDSSAYFFRLLSKFTEAFPDNKLVKEPQVHEAVKKAIAVYRLERYHFKKSKYFYPREPPWELPGDDGRGLPVNYTGMIWGAFRPSDDAQKYGYLVPSNIFVAAQLKPIEKFARSVWKDKKLAKDVVDLRTTILDGVRRFGTTKRKGKEVYCYEVDGLGGCNLMDDANVPSLLSLPYIDPTGKTFSRAIYGRTRKMILSRANPWYFEGRHGKGIGSPHTGQDMIWPMSLIMQAFTAQTEKEKKQVMKTLDKLNLRGHGMTESFNSDDRDQITRPWFGWPNALFSEYMISQGKCQPSMSDVAHFPRTLPAPKGPWSNMAGLSSATSFYTAPTEIEKLELLQISSATVKRSRHNRQAPTPVQEQGLDIDTQMPYGDLEPFGREDTAQELTESSVKESDQMVDQLERAEVAEEKRAVFRSLTRLRGAAITSFDGVARSQTGNIDEYNKIHKWRKTHPLHHLADEESDVSKWAFPDNADF